MVSLPTDSDLQSIGYQVVLGGTLGLAFFVVTLSIFDTFVRPNFCPCLPSLFGPLSSATAPEGEPAAVVADGVTTGS
jgi:hypothetical protein